jgi:hypothetical protein
MRKRVVVREGDEPDASGKGVVDRAGAWIEPSGDRELAVRRETGEKQGEGPLSVDHPVGLPVYVIGERQDAHDAILGFGRRARSR